MKIGMFIDSYYPKINGVITSVNSLKSGLKKIGHDVKIVTGGKIKYIKETNDLIEMPSINFPIWNCRIINPYSKENLEYIAKENFDIVHTHTPFTTGLLANKVAERNDIPNIHTYHTALDKCKDYMFHNFAYSVDVLLKLVNHVFCGNRIDQVIVPSEATKNMLKGYKVSSEKLSVIPTGYNQEHTNISKLKLDRLRHTLGLEIDDFVLLFVGRLSKEKGIDFLVKQQLDINKVNSKVKLVIVGDGPESKSLQSLAKKLGIKDKIIFTGIVNHANINMYYQMADLAITASKAETQGLTIGEALINNLPVCCIDSFVFKMSITENYNGTFFGSSAEYKEKIIGLSTNQETINRWRQVALSTLTTDIEYAKSVEKVYEKALRMKRINT